MIDIKNIEDYDELFDLGEENISAEQMITLLKTLQAQPPIVYCGKGAFSKMTIKTDKGISDLKIKSLCKKHSKLILPDDYVSLLKFSNKISFFEYADDIIYSLEDAFEYTDKELINSGFINFARCGEDEFYLKCGGDERNVYVSQEGIDKLRPLNMSFLSFLEACLISGFSYFWLWGTDDFDLY